MNGDCTIDNGTELANKLIKLAQTTILSDNYNSHFPRLNHIVLEAIASGSEIALIDMPEVLLRLKIAEKYSLDELKSILN